MLDDIMKDSGIMGGDVQSNQFLITHRAGQFEEGLLFDPGGIDLMNPASYVKPK